MLQPIADGTDVFGAVLVLLAADAPDPSIFGSLETLAGNAGGVLRRARLHGEIERAYLSTVTALANALEAKDLQTQEHASATSRLAVAVGTRARPAAPPSCATSSSRRCCTTSARSRSRTRSCRAAGR